MGVRFYMWTKKLLLVLSVLSMLEMVFHQQNKGHSVPTNSDDDDEDDKQPE